jgi:hypothetical protein
MPGRSRRAVAAPCSLPAVYGRSFSAMLLRLLYWLAVLAISLVLVVVLILWFESQDQSSVERSLVPGPVRLSDLGRQLPLQPREHDDALRGAVERVAGGQHQPVVAPLS